jgi:hypothetical protein
MRRIRSPCCACATSGHVATAPPSAASNSRRPIVTVIRPSRARCVKATIPHHECAVLTAWPQARVGRRAPATTERRPAHDPGLISRVFLAAPLHFLPDLRNDVCARGFSEGDAARPITASQSPGRASRLASITGQGWRGRSSFKGAYLINRDCSAIAGVHGAE